MFESSPKLRFDFVGIYLRAQFQLHNQGTFENNKVEVQVENYELQNKIYGELRNQNEQIGGTYKQGHLRNKKKETGK